MNNFENLYKKLQNRYERVMRTNFQSFHFTLKLWLHFLEQQPLTRGILNRLRRQYPELESQTKGQPNLRGDNDTEHAALSLFILFHWADAENPDLWIGESLAMMRHERKHDIRLAHLKDVFLEPLHTFIIESLDDSRAVLAQLLRYKHRTEWYRRDELHERYEDQTKRGERHLANDLYLYLHDQGIDFIVEPHTVSGIPDLLVQADEFNRIIADAKVFDPGRSKGISYLAKGVNQVYIYLNDYNEPFGYLVIFNVSGKDLSIDVSGVKAQVPYVTHNGKTIFLHVIDLYPHDTSASKRGTLETVVWKETNIIQVLEEPEPEENNDEQKRE